ncbi:alkaline phosphatase D family protein [Shewanella sp. Isolate11]|uniref:alkaline phosphatase D family protein n=1 Tax=Shewanella sp. Isolate11 TaxID=2908530 RepID=UPI001EFC6FC8|nr:alkaline phosphatase D family protein [Shewanella sp. Isolate11]MCG9698208.1 alkaline phosphatase family protein [Shewanella sp. Isolate11]
MLRHCDQDNFTLWLVSSKRLNQLELQLGKQRFQIHASSIAQAETNPEHIQRVDCFKLGEQAFQYLIHLKRPQLNPVDIAIPYRLHDGQYGELFSNIDNLTYSEASCPEFVVKTDINKLIHGSCRNAHHHSDDALVACDTLLEQNNGLLQQDDPLAHRPALLMLSGDQIYVDDVAGPMLYAIGKVIDLLGLKDEQFQQQPLLSAKPISYQAEQMYLRHKQLLPHTEYPAGSALVRWYINHPIFTSSIAENHLVSLAEICALYLLYWSPELWQLIDIPKQVDGLTKTNQLRWQREWQHLLEFKAGLAQVRRLMAHLPTYMIFDDHDITDDWNLTAKWEQAAYSHPFSKRIIGNALIDYTLFQALGNQPEKFTSIMPKMSELLAHTDTQHPQDLHDELIDNLLHFEQWHYTLNTRPKLVVLDTRTQRWRSESNLAKPSGLMDWEALMEFQQQLVAQDKVIIVSAAPIFGVKLIEAVQRSATFIGASLLVDAENWMAHPGTANTLLSIFQHRKTPDQFVILSGDVHYSFAYDISIRFRTMTPKIYQITCSGIKNQFPEKLLPLFDKLNGWLYGHFSPLNFFTKRKRMSIRGRRPDDHHSRRLVNKSGIGIVTLAANGAPTEISVLHADSSQTHFKPPRQS